MSVLPDKPPTTVETAETRDGLLSGLRTAHPRAAESLDFHIESLRFLVRAGGPMAKTAVLFVAQEIMQEIRE